MKKHLLSIGKANVKVVQKTKDANSKGGWTKYKAKDLVKKGGSEIQARMLGKTNEIEQRRIKYFRTWEQQGD